MKTPRIQPWALRAAFFWALLALIIYGVDAVLMHGLRIKRIGDFGVWNRVVNGQINADILVTGSSRALAGVDPGPLAEATGRFAFNIAVDGSNPNLQRPWLETYLAHNRKPEVVIQVLDLTSLRQRPNPYQPWQYVPYLHEQAIYQNLLQLMPEFRLHKYLPLYSFAMFPSLTLKSLSALLGRDRPEQDERRLGFKAMHLSWRGDFARYKQMYPDGVSVVIEPEAVRVLRRIIEVVLSKHSKIIMVFSPEYFDNHALTLNRRELFQQFEDLADEYQIPFWDYSELPVAYDTVFFYNSQHLNAKGAEVFSRRLGADLANWLGTHAVPESTITGYSD